MDAFAMEKRLLWLSICVAMARISSRTTSLLLHDDVVRDEIRVIAPHMLSQKHYNLDLIQLFLSPLRMHFLFSRL